MKGQGSIEYLLLLGGAILVVFFVITIIILLSQVSFDQSQGTASDVICTGLPEEACYRKTFNIGPTYYVCEFNPSTSECYTRKADVLLTSCGTLSQSGKVHLLLNDITTTLPQCIDIEGSNVIFNGGGKKIHFTGGTGLYDSVIDIEAPSARVQNVTVETNEDSGIYVGDVSANLFYNSITVSATNPNGRGIYVTPFAQDSVFLGNQISTLNPNSTGIHVTIANQQPSNVLLKNNSACNGFSGNCSSGGFGCGIYIGADSVSPLSTGNRCPASKCFIDNPLLPGVICSAINTPSDCQETC